VRILTVSLLSILVAMASADQLIDIPTARKVPFDDFRYEFRASPTSHGDVAHYLGIGLGPSFELDLREITNAGTNPVGTFDFSYSYLTPIPGLAPGISFGVQDAANLTSDGRRFYAVTTLRNEMDEIPGNVYADITLGFQVGSLTSPFVGVSLPFSKTFYAIAEHSGFRLSSGVEFRPAPQVALRFISRDRETLISLSAMLKF